MKMPASATSPITPMRTVAGCWAAPGAAGGATRAAELAPDASVARGPAPPGAVVARAAALLAGAAGASAPTNRTRMAQPRIRETLLLRGAPCCIIPPTGIVSPHAPGRPVRFATIANAATRRRAVRRITPEHGH